MGLVLRSHVLIIVCSVSRLICNSRPEHLLKIPDAVLEGDAPLVKVC